VDEAESELERQEVKVRKGRKLKKEVCVEAGKEESLENKKQIDTSVSEALLKVLEILPADTSFSAACFGSSCSLKEKRA